MAMALTKIGRYQIVSELGRGSMGVVYQAHDPVIGRMIAIKTMLTEGLGSAEFVEYKARFQREAQTAGVLAHPNIVTVYDFGEDNGLLYLAMEVLEGQSLEKVVEAQNILPVETIIPIYEQVCSALHHAHTHNIVHRDVKPGNIMILSSGLVKVMDFGIAKMMSTGMTQAGQILGTPNYMSPEQVKGRPVDGRSDIFSLGVILYELLTGEKPFGGQNITTVIYKIINENPIPPRELDAAIHPGLSHITSKALAKNPDERYQACRELAEDLKNFKNLPGITSPSATVIFKAPQYPAAPPDPIERRPAVTRQRPEPPAARDAEPAPARPLSVQVIPPAQPQPRETSLATWVALIILLLGGLGAGYYYYFIFRASSVGSVSETPGSEPIKTPTPPGAPKVGALAITANVIGARISIDGKYSPDWLTPHTFTDLDAGPHQVVVSKEGYGDFERTVSVEGDQTTPLTVDLASVQKPEPPLPRASPPAPRMGQLVVSANVDGARISIDGLSEPDWLTPHTFPDLTAGSHVVAVSKEGYDSVERVVTVQGGRTVPLGVELPFPGGVINIVTVPAGADVTIDDQPMGTSPVRANVRTGQHTFTARLPGLAPEEGTFTMKNGGILTKKIIWSNEPAAPTGIVEVRTIPPGATVLAEGTPMGSKTPTSFRLSVGHHTLTISMPGFADAQREIDVPADDPAPIKVNVSLATQ